MLTNEEIVDHVQHMGCEETDNELIASDDDVDMEPSKMHLVECRGFLKGLRYLSWGRRYVTSPTTNKQITTNASNVCYEPQARGNQFCLFGSGYLRSC